MFHYRKTHKRYHSFPKIDGCHFCGEHAKIESLRETEHARIVPNRVFYDLWELRRVIDHLMIIPKRHVRSLQELTEAERLDVMALMAEYEAAGYNVYARALSSKQRSVAHQHTHLIKTVDKQAHGSFFIKKPYWLIKF